MVLHIIFLHHQRRTQGQEKKERTESIRAESKQIESNGSEWNRTKCFGFLEISFLCLLIIANLFIYFILFFSALSLLFCLSVDGEKINRETFE